MSSQRRPGASRASALHRRDREPDRHRLERGDPRPARRRCPRPPPARPRRAPARSSSAPAWRTSTIAGSVRRTPRPARSSSATPASRSSTASCWETADGVNCSASATAAIVPRACSSCSRRRRRRSSIRKQRYCVTVKKSRSLLHGRDRPPSAHALPRSPPVPRLRRRVRRDGDLRQARLRRGRERRHAAGRALRARRRAVLAVAACSGGARALRALPRRDIGIALALGAVGYSAQAGGYFAALERLDASLLSLLVYTFPAIVAVAAIALGRERASRRTAVALALASTGLVLVLAGAAAGALDPVGTALGLAAAVVYSAYILSSEGVAARIGPLALSTLVCTGAATTLTLGGLVGGELDPGARERGGLRLAGRPRRRLDGRGDRPLLRRAAARRPDRRVDPVDPRAGGHRRAGVRRVRRVARPRAAGRRRPRCAPRMRAQCRVR